MKKTALIEPPHIVLPLYFKGGQIHCCQLDGYRDHCEALLNRLQQIESYISSQNTTLRIWFNVSDSKLPPSIMEEIVQTLYRVRKKIYKISMIGLGLKKFAFRRLIKRTFQEEMLAIQFYQDAEIAKNWLV